MSALTQALADIELVLELAALTLEQQAAELEELDELAAA